MVTIRKILVPTDLSNLSLAAIGYALSLARDHGSEVLVLHVISTQTLTEQFSGTHAGPRYIGEGIALPAEAPVAARAQPDLESLIETKRQTVSNFLQQNVGPALLKQARIKPLVKLGKVVDEIVAAAAEEQCDLIVMTTRGSRLRQLLGASVAERVLRRAPCPFLCLRASAEVRTEKDERVPASRTEKWAA